MVNNQNNWFWKLSFSKQNIAAVSRLSNESPCHVFFYTSYLNTMGAVVGRFLCLLRLK